MSTKPGAIHCQAARLLVVLSPQLVVLKPICWWLFIASGPARVGALGAMPFAYSISARYESCALFILEKKPTGINCYSYLLIRLAPL